MQPFFDHKKNVGFPFVGQLTNGEAAYRWLKFMACDSASSVSICSAFLRSEALRAVYFNCQNHSYGRILSRWRLSDLVSGSSDLDAYLLAKQLGLAFYVKQDFHGKVFSVPNKGIIVGSANSTLSGFGLKEFANSEVCTLVPSSEANHLFVDQLFYDAVEMNDDLFKDLSSFVKDSGIRALDQLEWPKELKERLFLPEFSGRILLSECLSSIPFSNGQGGFVIPDEKDVYLLGLRTNQIDIASLRVVFKSTRIFRWLSHTLMAAKGDIYFGSLSAMLHNALLDDPAVYRRDVKGILQTLLKWCQLLEIDSLVMDRPNHSQRIRTAGKNH
jgi:hypothetical protein